MGEHDTKEMAYYYFFNKRISKVAKNSEIFNKIWGESFHYSDAESWSTQTTRDMILFLKWSILEKIFFVLS